MHFISIQTDNIWINITLNTYLGNCAGVTERKEEVKSYIILAALRSYHGEGRCNKKEDNIITTKNRLIVCSVEVLSSTNHTISEPSVKEKRAQLWIKTVQHPSNIQEKEWLSSTASSLWGMSIFITD